MNPGSLAESGFHTSPEHEVKTPVPLFDAHHYIKEFYEHQTADFGEF